MPLKILMAMAVFILVLSVGQASANHDSIYSPCGTEYGFIHMTYEEWAAHITTMEANGTIPPGVVYRYWEANETTGKGTNVQEDGTIPAWDQWARGLTDGQILSIADWANGNYPEIEQLNFDAGLVPEWVLDANQQVRRFNDPFWSQPNPMSPSFTVWQSLCMADYGYSIPVMEINANGVWESNIPTTVATAQTDIDLTGSTSGSEPNQEATPSTTTQAIVAPITSEQTPTSTTTTQAVEGSIPTTEAPVTTTTQAIAVASLNEVAPDSSPPALQAPTNTLPAGYDLFTAQYEGWPFERTLRLLEVRYPQGTPNKYHFRLSYAVDFLQAGGMVGQLDTVWNAG